MDGKGLRKPLGSGASDRTIQFFVIGETQDIAVVCKTKMRVPNPSRSLRKGWARLSIRVGWATQHFGLCNHSCPNYDLKTDAKKG